jgi:4-amino-4-deoxy-L-arabinose transferase-like glycosyltransferase
MASSVFVFTPWSVVVGTLAYNEMPMLALFAGALLAATSLELSPARRGMVSGVLVAAACGVKPTALLFVGVPTGIVLLGMMPAREWWKAVVPGVGVALLFLMPWMVRNAVACGNPVFPLALTKWLGTAHWDVEQVERFLRHHVSHEPIAERLRLLVMPDANDPAARPGHPVFRGLTHPQWGVFFGLTAMGMAHAVFWLRGVSRRLAILVSLAIVVQVVLWLLATHVQSRFLLPLIVPCVMMIAMASRAPEGSSGPRRLSRRAMSAACWLGVIAQGGFLAATIASQHDGHPAMLLPLEPADFTAAAWYRETSQARREELVASSPAIATAVLVPKGERVALLGDAAPLYYPPGAAYNTVWDRWPFQDGRLTDAEARYVLVDFASIDRYERSGYLPPGVTLRGVQGWVARSCRLIRAWDDQGKVLVEVER